MQLEIVDLDIERQTLMIRRGKGNKDRLVPVGERALDWIEIYQIDVRPRLVTEPDEGVLFVSSTGHAFSPNALTGLIHKYIRVSPTARPGRVICSGTRWQR